MRRPPANGRRTRSTVPARYVTFMILVRVKYIYAGYLCEIFGWVIAPALLIPPRTCARFLRLKLIHCVNIILSYQTPINEYRSVAGESASECSHRATTAYVIKLVIPGNLEFKRRDGPSADTRTDCIVWCDEQSSSIGLHRRALSDASPRISRLSSFARVRRYASLIVQSHCSVLVFKNPLLLLLRERETLFVIFIHLRFRSLTSGCKGDIVVSEVIRLLEEEDRV